MAYHRSLESGVECEPRIHKATDGKIDWSLTAWEVSRRAQLRRSRGLTLREGSAGVEGTADVARRFGKTRRTAGAGGLEIEPVERAELALQAAELAPADFREEDVGEKPSKVHP
jgi:hypothetical protein